MINECLELKKMLPRSWIPFFTRFGRLLDIQKKVVPVILAGKNVVVASPTASGKTEAVVAPVAELLCRNGIPLNRILVIYICPTRALANDMYQRISGPLQEMGFSVELKHSDKSALSKTVIPNFLITTPESLDSLMCRHASLLSVLAAVIIDEIHLLDNTYRGDQLRVLLQRLKFNNNQQMSIHIISATLSNPRELAQRYVESFETIVSQTNQRPIDYNIFENLLDIQIFIRSKKWKKVLYFCNFPHNVERTAQALKPLWKPYPVVFHHGSLDRKLRLEAEEVMKESLVAACVATSTLEIGIDIGNIDLIVLVDVPWTIAGLLQRVGRGKRRENMIYAAALATTEEERASYDHMFKMACSGFLPEYQYLPDISVAVQQILSFGYQMKQGFLQQQVNEILACLCEKDMVGQILLHLVDKGFLERSQGRYFISTKVADMAELGKVHSNIPNYPRPFHIIELGSGVELEKTLDPFGDEMIINHNLWNVETVMGRAVMVSRKQSKSVSNLLPKYFIQGEFSALLPSDIKVRRQ